jgi:hypothetical protein
MSAASHHEAALGGCHKPGVPASRGAELSSQNDPLIDGTNNVHLNVRTLVHFYNMLDNIVRMGQAS